MEVEEHSRLAQITKEKTLKEELSQHMHNENGYYSRDFKIGARKKDPFLNIIGTHDQYFGKYSPYEENNNNGHCAMALLEFKNAKVVLLPKTKHNVIENKYTIPEVVNFLKFHTSK